VKRKEEKAYNNTMDTQTLQMAGLSTTGVAVILIVYRLLKSIRGKRFVSSCCGKKAEIGFDVQDITPTSSSTQQKPSSTEPTIPKAPSLAGFPSAPVPHEPQAHQEPKAVVSPLSVVVAI
jgi:hypothetical protein